MKRTLIPTLTAALLACFTSQLQATPYAAAVTNDAGTVRFILNEDAASVTVWLNNATATNDLGALLKGSNSFSLAGATNFQIRVSHTSAAGFVHKTTGTTTLNSLNSPRGTILQTSSDANPLLSFNLPRGMTVNRNPKSPYFGRVYVGNSAAGTVTNATGRVLGDGVYVLNPDLTDALGQGDAPLDGGLAAEFAAGGTTDPYRMTIGVDDDNLYISDWSDENGSVFVTDPNLTPGSGANVLPGLKGFSTPVGLDRVHGSINQSFVEGSLAAGNLTVYTIDEDLQTDRAQTSLTQVNSLWRFDLGASLPPIYNGDPASLTMPTKLWSPVEAQRTGIQYSAGVVGDLDRGRSGHFYVSVDRQNNGGNSGLIVLDPNGSVLWNSSSTTKTLTTSNTLDYCFDTYGLSTSIDQSYVVTLRRDSRCILIPMTNNVPYMPARVVLLTFPSGITARAVRFDAAGNLYMVTTGGQLMRVFSPGGTTLAVTGGDTTGTNGTFRLVSAPVFRQSPATQFVDQGATMELVSFVEGMGEISYQWQHNGTNIDGATNCVYSKPDFGGTDTGDYSVIASNELGLVTSAIGTVSVTPPPVLDRPQVLSANEVVISWSSAAPRTYWVQSNNDLATSNWQTISTVVAKGNTTSITNDPAGANELFYRVVRLPYP